MSGREGAWVGWTGDAGGDVPEPFESGGMWLRAGRACPRPRSRTTTRGSATTPCGRSTTTSSSRRGSGGGGTTGTAGSTTGSPRWPPRSPRRARRSGCTTTSCSSSRPCCAPCARTCGSAGSTTSRSRRSSCSPRSPGGASSSRGCSAPTCWASSAPLTPRTSCASYAGCWTCPVKGDQVTVHSPGDAAQAPGARGGVPDLGRRDRARGAGPHARRSWSGPGRSAATSATRSTCCWASTGSTTPRGSATGSRRSRSCCPTVRSARRRRCWCRWPRPSRERVEAYRELRDQVEVTVGRINGEEGRIGKPAVHYLHHSYPARRWLRSTWPPTSCSSRPLRDGMNLVAKEYVACRYDEGGALVLQRVHRCRRGPAPGLPVQPARHLRAQGRDPGRAAGRPAGCPAPDAGHAPAGLPARRPALGPRLPRGAGAGQRPEPGVIPADLAAAARTLDRPPARADRARLRRRAGAAGRPPGRPGRCPARWPPYAGWRGPGGSRWHWCPAGPWRACAPPAASATRTTSRSSAATVRRARCGRRSAARSPPGR